MPRLDKGSKFEFIVSTPSHNALEQKDTKKTIRKHVMKPFAKKGHRTRAVVIEGQALTSYLSNRRQASTDVLANIADTLPERPPSPLDAAVLLGATRTNPFARYPIRMDMKDHELIHHGK